MDYACGASTNATPDYYAQRDPVTEHRVRFPILNRHRISEAPVSILERACSLPQARLPLPGRANLSADWIDTEWKAASESHEQLSFSYGESRSCLMRGAVDC